MSDLAPPPPPPPPGVDPATSRPAKQRGNALLWWLIGGGMLLVAVCCGGPFALAFVLSRATVQQMRAMPSPMSTTGGPVPGYFVPGGYAVPGGSGGETLQGLDRAWRSVDPATGVARDPATGRVWAGLPNMSAMAVDPSSGRLSSPLSVAVPRPVIRAGNLSAEAGTELVVFQYWSTTVSARLEDGDVLWDYAAPSSIDDVALADLDGDGLDEVVIGLGGEGGVTVLHSDGSPWWESRATGETAFVSAGDVDRDGRLEVIASTLERGALAFESDGSGMAAQSWIDFTKLAVAFAAPMGKAGVVALAVGLDESREVIVGVRPDGTVAWTTALPPTRFTNGLGQAIPAKTKPYVAISSNQEGVRVLDLDTGAIVAALTPVAPTQVVEVAWAEDKPGARELLLVADGYALSAYAVNPLAPETLQAGGESGASVGTQAESSGTPASAEGRGITSWAG